MDMHRARNEAKGIGRARDSEEFRINTRRLAQFAEAIGDTNPAHLAGSIATPVFHHVPVMQSMVEVLNAITEGFILHGEHDFHLHAPMRPGQRLFSNSELIGIRNSPAGSLFHIRSDTRTHDGKAISTQYATCLVQNRKAEDEGEAPPPKPKAERHGEPAADTYAIALDQTLRYADAARDYSAYTIDAEAAGGLGLPAPIVHGMCTLALVARGIIERACGGDVERLKRLGCRFSHPLYLTDGQAVVAKTWTGGDVAQFEAVDNDGNLIVKNGFAEVRP